MSLIEIVEVLLKLRYFCPLACLLYFTYLIRNLTSRYPQVNIWFQQRWTEADGLTWLVHSLGIAATIFTLYLLWSNRARLSAAANVWRHPAAEIESGPARLTEHEVQRRVVEFSRDAVEVRVFAGDGGFLNRSNPQHDELKKLGQDCSILLNEGHSVEKKSLVDLIDSRVGVRLYPKDKPNPHLRGRLKESSSGRSACLFDKGAGGYKLLPLNNTTVVQMLYERYDEMFSRGRNPVLKHIIFDLGGVYFEGDFGRFLEKINPILDTQLRVSTAHYGCVDEDLNLGRKTILQWVAESVGRKLSASEEMKVQSLWETNWTLNARMQEIAESLKKAGYEISLSSNCDKGNADRYEERGWFVIADHMFLSCERKALKPRPEYFRPMIFELGKDPAACILIDDHRDNVDEARRLGLSVILVDRTKTPEDKAQQVINELAKLNVPVSQKGVPQ